MSIQTHQFDKKLTPPRRNDLPGYWSPPTLREEIATPLRIKFVWLVQELVDDDDCANVDLNEILAPAWLAERGLRGGTK